LSKPVGDSRGSWTIASVRADDVHLCSTFSHWTMVLPTTTKRAWRSSKLDRYLPGTSNWLASRTWISRTESGGENRSSTTNTWSSSSSPASVSAATAAATTSSRLLPYTVRRMGWDSPIHSNGPSGSVGLRCGFVNRSIRTGEFSGPSCVPARDFTGATLESPVETRLTPYPWLCP